MGRWHRLVRWQTDREEVLEYREIIKGKFIKRVNRFIARVEAEGEEVLCHVKNAGRMRELFVEGVPVYLEKSDNPNRKTAYSLVGVKKDGFLVNVDSQAPNKMVQEWLLKTDKEKKILCLKPEAAFGNSRFDFYLETTEKKEWIEVKGVTLVEEGIALFPDAPTERGVKHIKELSRAVEEGYLAALIFVIQRKGVRWFQPNVRTHPEFAQALKEARKKGVSLLCYDSIVTECGAVIDERIKIRL
jgi:sugar fermentation stimulation protein A